MNILCLSASNIKHKKDSSTSTQACRLIEAIAAERIKDDLNVEILQLTEYEPNPCIGCGKCFETNTCAHDTAFNLIYEKMQGADALFIVSPHYAPIPAKLCMILEKIEEMAYLHWFKDHAFKASLYNKPVGIIGHGGSDDRKEIDIYRRIILDNIADALKTSMLDVVGTDSYKYGVVFMLNQYKRDENSLFPLQFYDWEEIRAEITPLVENVLKKGAWL